MMETFKLIDIVIVIGICQGIFLSLTLQRITNNNSKANNILSLLIAIATLMLIGRFLFFRFLTLEVFQWSLFGDSLIFLFGPLLYMYVRRFLFKGGDRFRLSAYHYIPFMGIIILSAYYAIRYAPPDYYQLYLDGKLILMFNGVVVIGLFSNFYYLIRSFLMVTKFKKLEKQRFSFDQNPLRYLYFFLFAISMCLLAWLFSFISASVFDRAFIYLGYDSIWAAIPVFIYVIGYFSLKQPELFRIAMEVPSKEKRDRLGEIESRLLSKKLDSLMHNEKLFLQGDLTLKEVAVVLQTSTNNISWLLNNVYKSTFYDFINGYRVKEFVHKVENREHLKHTILALSMDVGFNSKSTFNKAFKNEMNETPSNFIKKHRAA